MLRGGMDSDGGHACPAGRRVAKLSGGLQSAGVLEVLAWGCVPHLHTFRIPLERGYHFHLCVPQASNVGACSQHLPAISPAPTSQGRTPTRQSACG